MRESFLCVSEVLRNETKSDLARSRWDLPMLPRKCRFVKAPASFPVGAFCLSAIRPGRPRSRKDGRVRAR
jgi:hypothetical protein